MQNAKQVLCAKGQNLGLAETSEDDYRPFSVLRTEDH